VGQGLSSAISRYTADVEVRELLNRTEEHLDSDKRRR